MWRWRRSCCKRVVEGALEGKWGPSEPQGAQEDLRDGLGAARLPPVEVCSL